LSLVHPSQDIGFDDSALARSEGGAVSDREIVLEPDLCVRTSTGPAPSR
jgi:hypothetical protein